MFYGVKFQYIISVGERSELKNFRYNNSSSTCFTKSNSNKLLCRQAKQAKKIQMLIVLQSQILINYCIGKHSKLKISNRTCFTKSNSNILMCRRAKQAKKISDSTCFIESNYNILLCMQAKNFKSYLFY